MRAVAVVEAGKIELVSLPRPEPEPYDAIVRNEIGYLCNATDHEIIEGNFPGVDEYPLILGHETAGIVEAVGEKVTSFKPGDRVVGGLLLDVPDPAYASGFGSFSDLITTRDHQAMVDDGVADEEHGWDEVYKIQRVVPQDIPVEAAGLLCMWREVLGSFSDFRLERGQDVLIVGGGPVGLSFVKFARLFGMNYIGLCDSHEEKRQKALGLGADEVFERNDPAMDELVPKRGKPLDVVIDAVGREEIINNALPLVRGDGAVCVYGVVTTHPIQIYNQRGPKNINILLHQWPTRDTESAAQEVLCDWIREGKLEHEGFVTEEFPLEDIQKAVDLVNSRVALKVLLRF